MNNNRPYWANLAADEIGDELKKKVDSYFEYINKSGHFQKIKKSYRTYYGYSNNGTSSDISAVGASGELSSVVVSDYRNLIQHILIMIIQQIFILAFAVP